MNYAYTKRGQVETVTRYADLAGTVTVGQSAYTYDDAARLTGIAHKNGAGSALASYGYTYDDADRLTSETINGVTRTYGYDDANQLTDDNGTAYTYDETGNRTNTGYVTGPGNRLVSDGTWAYTYDDAGQVTTKSNSSQPIDNTQTWTYEYDHRGQLISATVVNSSPYVEIGDPPSDTTEVDYAYDAFGNRIRRTVSTYEEGPGHTPEDPNWVWAAVEDARYAMDGWDPAKPGAVGTEAFDVYADLDGAGAVTTRRVFGSGFDDLGARLTADGKVGWYATDGRGSVRAIFDNAGVAVSTATYDTWGNFLGGVPADRYAFTGREYDPTTGLQHNRGREYNPSTGRWMSEDPIRDDHANAYRYVGNSPTNATDPSGFQEYKLSKTLDPLRSYSTSSLILVGRQIAEEGFTSIDTAGFNKSVAATVLHGFNQAKERPNPLLRGTGYCDEFGWHRSFCMSCHDRSNPNSRLKGWLAVEHPAAVAGKTTAELFILIITAPWPWGRPLQAAGNVARAGMAAGARTAATPVASAGRITIAGEAVVARAFSPVAISGGARSAGQVGIAPGAGATSRLVPGGGLAAHEAAGGHTIARHVGQTDAQLAARLAAEPGIRGASTFTSRAAAESAIARTIDTNQAAINTWLQGSGNQLVVRHTLGETVGRSFPRGAACASDVSSVSVVLRRDPSLPTGYRIHTAYPAP